MRSDDQRMTLEALKRPLDDDVLFGDARFLREGRRLDADGKRRCAEFAAVGADPIATQLCAGPGARDAGTEVLGVDRRLKPDEIISREVL